MDHAPPALLLAVLSVTGGWIGIPAVFGGNNGIEHFLDSVFVNGAATEAAASATGLGLELVLAVVSVLAALAGFYFAYVFYYLKPGTADALAERNRPVYDLVKNKYWVDEFYNNFWSHRC